MGSVFRNVKFYNDVKNNIKHVHLQRSLNPVGYSQKED